MKKLISNVILVFVLSISLSSCFTYTFVVGKGPQTGMEITKKNHYLIYGLAPLNISDPVQMAGGAEDYEVTIEHTFIDGLLNAITLGIYNPTTTTVRK